MFKNYLRTSVRNLLRNRLYSGINIAGLTIGLTACLLVATVVINDLSYDKQWKNAKDIYRIISINNNTKGGEERFPSSFTGLGPALKRNFPEVRDYCRMSVREERLQVGADKDGVKMNILSAEPSVWAVLDFTVTEGAPRQFVKGYSNLVITKKFKQQYFSNTDPVGKIVKNLPSFGDTKQYLITGVINDIPSNTHLYADAMLIHEFRPTDNELYKQEYGSFYQQYLLLRPGTNMQAFTNKVNNWYANDFVGKKATYSYSFQPITDVYLRSTEFAESVARGSIQNVYIFSGVAILLLLIACINFINLTTARALKRVRETGIRKVLGADKKQLVGQFLFESLLFFCIAFLLSLLLYNLFIPSVETFLARKLALSLTHNLLLLGVASGIMLLVSLFTGLYPAFVLSRPKPAIVLKNKLANSAGVGFLRKSLVTVQFVISIVILISAVIVQNQLHFLTNKDLGFDKNNLFKTDFTSWETKGDAFKQAVLQLPEVQSVSLAGWAPSLGGGSMSAEVEDPKDPKTKIKEWYISGDIDLAATLKLQLQQGRYLNPAFATDMPNTDSLMEKDFTKMEEVQKTQPVLITAYTAKLLGIHELNKPVKGVQGIPVGILKDFNNESLKEKMKPCIVRAAGGVQYGYMLVRVRHGADKAFMEKYHTLWQKFYPSKVLQFDWVDNLLDAQYKSEQKLQQLVTFFSYLAVFLACLGLFGLTTFTAEQRVKEIGIRKVIGATVFNITSLLSVDFLKLVLLAVVIASPVSAWLMNNWLQNFAYRINIEWWVFAVVGIGALLMAFATISFKAIKAAMANPAESLRAE
ncbi:MAG TPA: FtsX-like permease family protein [Chitinophagaceae bacterium]|nr:FtsX-like permease family protein [Chitinophagaceae bacterium]